jgi:glycosyltransferase involved in cell wall biosynthesis
MKNLEQNGNIFELDKSFSTTRRVTKQKPLIKNQPEDKVKTQLFLPAKPDRKGEGGLRTQGYFKRSEKDKPLISVITVVFNGKKYLEQTIQSVIHQTYDNVEYIIIDGGSTDGTLDIIRKYEEMVDYWVSEPDEGISDAFNKSIRVSTGNWLNFLNAGDSFINNQMINEYVTHFENKNISIVTAFAKIGRKGTIPKRILHDNDPLCKKALISHQASFVEKKVFKKVGGFKTDYKIRMDYELWLRVLQEYHFIFIDKIMVDYIKGGVSGKMVNLYHLEELKANKHFCRSIIINIYLLLRYIKRILQNIL